MAKKNESGIIWGVLLLLVLVAAVGYQQGWFLSSAYQVYNSWDIYGLPQYGNIQCVPADPKPLPVEVNQLKTGNVISCPPKYNEGGQISSGYQYPKTVDQCEIILQMPTSWEQAPICIGNTCIPSFGKVTHLELEKCSATGCQTVTGIQQGQNQYKLLSNLIGNGRPEAQEWLKIKSAQYCAKLYGIAITCWDITQDDPEGIKAILSFEPYVLKETDSDNWVKWLTQPGEGCCVPSGAASEIAMADEIKVGTCYRPGNQPVQWVGHLSLMYGKVSTYNGQEVLCSGSWRYPVTTLELVNQQVVKIADLSNPTGVQCCPGVQPNCGDDFKYTTTLAGNQCNALTWNPQLWFKKTSEIKCQYSCVNGLITEKTETCRIDPCLSCDPKKGEYCFNEQCLSVGAAVNVSGQAQGGGAAQEKLLVIPQKNCVPFLQDWNGIGCMWNWNNVGIVALIVIAIIFLLFLSMRPQRRDPYAELSRELGI